MTIDLKSSLPEDLNSNNAESLPLSITAEWPAISKPSQSVSYWIKELSPGPSITIPIWTSSAPADFNSNRADFSPYSITPKWPLPVSLYTYMTYIAEQKKLPHWKSKSDTQQATWAYRLNNFAQMLQKKKQSNAIHTSDVLSNMCWKQICPPNWSSISYLPNNW